MTNEMRNDMNFEEPVGSIKHPELSQFDAIMAEADMQCERCAEPEPSIEEIVAYVEEARESNQIP